MSRIPKPKTIGELLEFCNQKELPLRTMRFFIGEDYPEPKAFGIFQDADGDFVVYKNKADGSRAIRYKGSDEAHAVSEIYEKMRSEIASRKTARGGSGAMPIFRNGGNTAAYDANSPEAKKKKKKLIIELSLLLAMIIACLVFLAVTDKPDPKRGYYRNRGNYYYYDTDDWYIFDGYDWDIIDDYDPGFEDYSDRYVSEDFNDEYNVGDFKNSEYYDGYYERSPSYDDDNNDWDYDDDDWDFDFGDWDTGATDWDTDW